jgi:hypothetical protein
LQTNYSLLCSRDGGGGDGGGGGGWGSDGTSSISNRNNSRIYVFIFPKLIYIELLGFWTLSIVQSSKNQKTESEFWMMDKVQNPSNSNWHISTKLASHEMHTRCYLML